MEPLHVENMDNCRKLYNRLQLESKVSYKDGYKMSHTEMSKLVPLFLEDMGIKEKIYSKCAQL